ncbi:hypothetical protein FGO68_gene10657 [Halteria grandinella]|uniref:Uncharacterized protein n=1 Tax=Halteria grandinella TaxID=5974 RepID=A0A8J8NGP2_HALGN|nr:hypothetical protein FGO68_gene10657 [Halteria grandinella]
MINFETKRQTTDMTPQQQHITISTENDPPRQGTFSPSRAEQANDLNFFGMQRKLYAFTTTTDSHQQHNTSSLSPHSTVSRQKSASKELSDLTNLIRKSSKNPIIKNAKAVVQIESTSTTLSRHLKQVFTKVNTQMKMKGLLQGRE